MANQLKRTDVAAWLRRQGFVERSSTGTGHWFYTHPATGVKIVLPGHGPLDLTKKVAGHIMRALESVGYDKERVRLELRGAA